MVYRRRGLKNGFLSFLYGEFWRNMRERQRQRFCMKKKRVIHMNG
jgi:hypothetical protein